MRSPCIVTVALTCVLFFFNDTATTEIYTLSLHDALPISRPPCLNGHPARHARRPLDLDPDRKSTRLNSSHTLISYAVFCLKKKKNKPARCVTDAVCCVIVSISWQYCLRLSLCYLHTFTLFLFSGAYVFFVFFFFF